jgi:acyl-CoA synthetase (AMP-forming)/AMP-acid ligase II
MGLCDDDVVWMPSPIGHSTGFNYGVRVALYHGLTLVLQDTWSAEVAASLIERFGCTYTVAATTFLGDLLQYASEHAVDMSSMRMFNSGGAPVPADLVLAAEELGFNVLRLYGSTEVLIATWNRPDSPREKKIQTDGRVLHDLEVEVRDDLGCAVLGQPGEIFVRGPSTSVGFLADPERTAATFDPEGWVRSGDIGILDEDEYLTIVGRKKEIIIRGGLNIAPREIEDIILRHAAIAAVAVVGLPDERLGEIACACVVLAEGHQLELQDVVTHLREQGVATFKLPELMRVVPSLPTTPTGKVQKFELIQAINAERAGA